MEKPIEEMVNPRSDVSIVPFIPEDILREIFLQLPAGALLRIIKPACKLWNSIVTEKEFVEQHYAMSVSSNRCAILIKNDYDNDKMSPYSYLIYDYYKDVKRWPSCNTMFTPPVDDAVPSEHSCRGQILFVNWKDAQPMYICNPISGVYIPLPPSNDNPEPLQSNRFIHGLGYDPISEAYKVVRMQYIYQLLDDEPFGMECHVCSIRSISGRIETTSWTDMGPLLSFVNILIEDGSCGVYSRSTLYWPIRESEQKIFAFDLRSHDFKTLKGPSSRFRSQSLSMLSVFRGDLAVIVFDDLYNAKCEVWVMEETQEGEMWRNNIVLPLEQIQFSISRVKYKGIHKQYNDDLCTEEGVRQAHRSNVFVPSLVGLENLDGP